MGNVSLFVEFGEVFKNIIFDLVLSFGNFEVVSLKEG